MAGLAEVSVAPAEPLGDGAAELALELDEVLPVLRTCLDASAHCDGGALAADELFFFEVLVVYLCCLAVFHAAEVGIGALEANVVRQFLQRITLQIIVKGVARLFQAGIFVQVFKLGSLHGHLDYTLLECDLLLNYLLQLGTRLAADLLLALWALEVVEHYTRTVPLLGYLLLHAVEVHDVAAVQVHRRGLANACAVADRTVVFLVTVEALVVSHLVDALWLETGQALVLASVAAAMVATRQHLVTARLHRVEALLLSAHVLEGWLHRGRRLSQLFAAEPALGRLLLIAGLTGVIGLSVAVGAEIFGT